MTRRRSQQRLRGHRSGFALVLALMLMAFVLLLLLSITTLVQVETRAANYSLEQLRARESARLALMLAIGDLQKHAGPDQRVSARADILGDGNYDPAAKFWTGVWDTTDPTAEPTWLVSGANTNLTELPTMQLVGTGSAGTDTTQHVTAPTLEVLGRNGNVSDKIAWWISDEGVKASFASTPMNRKKDPNFLESESIKNLQLLVATDYGLEATFEDYDRFNSSSAELLERIQSIELLLAQADFQSSDDFSENSDGTPPAEIPFHSLSPVSYGVLANTLDGPDAGLMQDLSLFPRLLGEGLEAYLLLGEANAKTLSAKDNEVAKKRLYTAMRGLDEISPLNDGDIALPIAPILTNFMMAFTVRTQSPVGSNPNLYLRMRFFCEFWNPYTHTILMNEGGDELDLELEITGLPEITVSNTSSSLASSAPINIQNLTSQVGHTDNAMVIRLDHDHSQDWLPGQTKNWVGVDASRATDRSPYFSINTDSKQWDASISTLGGARGIDTLEPRIAGKIRHQSTGTDSLSVKVYSVNNGTGSRKLISTLIGLEYEEVSTDPSGYTNTHSGAKFGYHFMLRGPELSDNDLEYFRGLWLNDHDPRNLAPTFNSNWYLDNDLTIPSGSPYIPVTNGITPINPAGPARLYEGTNDSIESDVFGRLLDRSSGTGSFLNVLWQDAPLFELPRDRHLSLASLQHIYFHNERPFQVGNSWGNEGDENTSAWFDRYYFSAISRDDDSADFDKDAPPSNPMLLYYNTIRFQNNLANCQTAPEDDSAIARTPAETLMVAKRFNINSTSVTAWKTALASLRINDFEYLNYTEDDTSDLSALSVGNIARAGSFARYSHSLEETYEAPKTPRLESGDPVAPSSFYRLGARQFDPSTFKALAQEIVDKIKERGRPFKTMEAFLSPESGSNQSLIESAIESVLADGQPQQWDHSWETTGVRGDNSDVYDIDHFSPGFLTQADVISAIGPMLAPRSDTFRIRARGTSLNAVGKELGSATIEAILQRVPEPASNPINNTSGETRRFIVLSTRWLSDDEL
ncbi:MAG: hypothetical protein ACI8ZW_002260 [Yoonia sp.]|jgi:hypothetical protein